MLHISRTDCNNRWPSAPPAPAAATSTATASCSLLLEPLTDFWVYFVTVRLSEDPSVERATVSEHKRFMHAVCSIQYISEVMRPDLAFAAHLLARHMAGSAKKHGLAIQHVMRYLQSTIDVCLTFNGSGNEAVVDVFSDADFAQCHYEQCQYEN